MFKKIIFIIFIFGTIAPNFANNYHMTDELPMLASNANGCDKSSSIIASINGHYLTIAFTENLGEVSIEIQNASGVPLDISFMDTPSGRQFYIPSTGSYTLIIKLENGDEYHGSFEVTD